MIMMNETWISGKLKRRILEKTIPIIEVMKHA